MVTSTAKLRIQPHDILFVRSSLNRSFWLGDENASTNRETDFNSCAGNLGVLIGELSNLQFLYSIVWTRNPPLPYPPLHYEEGLAVYFSFILWMIPCK